MPRLRQHDTIGPKGGLSAEFGATCYALINNDTDNEE